MSGRGQKLNILRSTELVRFAICGHGEMARRRTGPIRAFSYWVLIQEMISGQTCARAWRPTRIPRCCNPTPTSPSSST